MLNSLKGLNAIILSQLPTLTHRETKGKKTDTWNGSGNAFLKQSLCMAMEWQ